MSSADCTEVDNGAEDTEIADNDETENDNSADSVIDFSLEEELLFAHRLDEGYDVFEPRYDAWLKINGHHPVPLTPPPLPSQSSSIVSPASHHNTTPIQSSSAMVHFYQSSASYSPSRAPEITQSEPGVVDSPTVTPEQTPSNTKFSPLSDLLNLPVQKDPKPKTGRARVLTSSECLLILKEKEEKKKCEAEEKEKRKEERLLKRREKEEEQKRKGEEKARKAAEREAKRKQLAEEKLR